MFGEDVFSVISPKKIPREYRSVFVLGCQGPDIFYHSQRSKPVALQYGSLLHRRGYGIFCANLLENANDPGLGWYALGFMTHAILDRVCHPYIIYRAGKTYHSFFERILDVLMLKKLRDLTPDYWDKEEALAAVCENPPQGLKELLARCLAKTFPEKVNKDRSLLRRIDNTFADSARFYNMSSPAKLKKVFSDPNAAHPVFSRRALNYMYPENLTTEIDFLNLNRKPWRYPYRAQDGEMPKDDNRSFVEIYQDALKAAIDSIAPCVTQTEGIAEKIGNGCLSIIDEEGKPCAPNLTELLPFQEVLDQQARLRGI
jgi:hypothetical protein